MNLIASAVARLFVRTPITPAPKGCADCGLIMGHFIACTLRPELETGSLAWHDERVERWTRNVSRGLYGATGHDMLAEVTALRDEALKG